MQGERNKDDGRVSRLFISGPYEFKAPEDQDEEQEVRAEVAEALAKAYKMLKYDTSYLSPEEYDLLQGIGFDLPGPWLVGSERPLARTFERNGVVIGVIYFPFLKGAETVPSPETMSAVLGEAAKLRKRANVVIGVSPWGAQGEKVLIEARDTTPLDVILGSGPGLGMKGHVMGYGKTLWVRAYPKGKAVNVVRFLRIPKIGEKVVWTADETIGYDVIALKDNVIPDDMVEGLFEGFR